MDYKNYPKNPKIYSCEKCRFISYNKKDYERHLLTRKHLKETNELPMDSKPIFVCDCGKSYQHRQGLWKHSKKCHEKNYPKNPKKPNTNDHKPDIEMLTTLVLEVVKQNVILSTKIEDVCKSGLSINSNNIYSTNNNTFNLNVFLNEKCKDAMNITDFVDSIQLDICDLEDVGKLGYIEGISNIIVKNLKALDITERPIHCADKKREVIYIKDENKWEKEDDDRHKLKNVIKKIAYKNEKLIPRYKLKYPDYNNSDSKISDQYSKIVIEAMGGIGENNDIKTHKIVRNIAKEVVIDKSFI
jgi:hypothetical protein